MGKKLFGAGVFPVKLGRLVPVKAAGCPPPGRRSLLFSGAFLGHRRSELEHLPEASQPVSQPFAADDPSRLSAEKGEGVAVSFQRLPEPGQCR